MKPNSFTLSICTCAGSSDTPILDRRRLNSRHRPERAHQAAGARSRDSVAFTLHRWRDGFCTIAFRITCRSRKLSSVCTRLTARAPPKPGILALMACHVFFPVVQPFLNGRTSPNPDEGIHCTRQLNCCLLVFFPNL